jgi:endonuclease/exonuclease/phosphatase family metal-dependent hydrolase
LIGAIESSLRRLRRAFSRSVWWVYLARLSLPEADHGPGLVMLHVRGLSLGRFLEALRGGVMPFTRELVRSQEYQVLRQCDRPSLASFQQELFYGVGPVVDQASDRGRETPEALLRGGSSYADSLGGGASELHFHRGVFDGHPFLAGHPVLIDLFFLLHIEIPLRAAAAFVLAAIKAAAGRLRPKGRTTIELASAPSVARSVFMRELTVAGIEVDVTRGLPVIHATFDGEDLPPPLESGRVWLGRLRLAQIDAGIKRIWSASHRSARRHYDVWIYSTVEDRSASVDSLDRAAFVLVPEDTSASIAAAREGRLRVGASDLRRAALELLGRSAAAAKIRRRARPASRLRIMTYNVHSCVGVDGRLSPERIARLIARYGPDIVALQELDVARARTGLVDQAHLIASALRMDFHFHPVIHVEEERYGDAILTHLPVRLVKAGPLPAPPRREPRGALWVAIEAGDREIQVINTHLGLRPDDRRMQVDALLGPQWLTHPDCRDPVILCGDFNALPTSAVCRRIRARLKDSQIAFTSLRPSGTFFGRFPLARIDYIFVSEHVEVLGVEVPSTRMARVASDHLPLIIDCRLDAEMDKAGDRGSIEQDAPRGIVA